MHVMTFNAVGTPHIHSVS